MENYIKKAADAFLVERPYGGYVLNLQKLKAYNRLMFPLAMALNREL